MVADLLDWYTVGQKRRAERRSWLSYESWTNLVLLVVCVPLIFVISTIFRVTVSYN